jgi:hypothetical protein
MSSEIKALFFSVLNMYYEKSSHLWKHILFNVLLAISQRMKCSEKGILTSSNRSFFLTISFRFLLFWNKNFRRIFPYILFFDPYQNKYNTQLNGAHDFIQQASVENAIIFPHGLFVTIKTCDISYSSTVAHVMIITSTKIVKMNYLKAEL